MRCCESERKRKVSQGPSPLPRVRGKPFLSKESGNAPSPGREQVRPVKFLQEIKPG